MKSLILSDIDIISIFVSTVIIIGIIYVLNYIIKDINRVTLVASVLIVTLHEFIQRVLKNILTIVKAKHHLKDRSLYINSSLL